mmetsp:Transcript_116229/g.183725  ORF Transcript_116229/g.183725 Transcript_116229/m.183725 type:complete len:258 (+) Transcript_116229:62-835(+)
MTRSSLLKAFILAVAIGAPLGSRIKHSLKEATQGSHEAKGSCEYPQWMMPEVGTDSRCNHGRPEDAWKACPKRTSKECVGYEIGEGETCKVTCKDDPSGSSETLKCVGENEWEVVGTPLTCPLPFCNYPQWMMPEVGTNTRCDHGRDARTACPKRCAECEDIFGITGGETCKVTCADGTEGFETLKCVGMDKWEVVGNPLTCEGSKRAEQDVRPVKANKCNGLNTFQCWITSGCRCDGGYNGIKEYFTCGSEGCQSI